MIVPETEDGERLYQLTGLVHQLDRARRELEDL